MWEQWNLILENSYDKEEETYDFKVLDPPCESMNKHPLMLVARSGQEVMLTHDTTTTLLNLKWRYLPRALYYTNILMYLGLLIVFALYTAELTDISHALTEGIPSEETGRSKYFIPILVFVSLDILKIFIQVFLSDG